MRENQKYVTVPGSATHELPPLLVRTAADALAGGEIIEVLEEAEEMLPGLDEDHELTEQRKYDLAATLAEQYHRFVTHWRWGDSVVEWTRQCEITFESQAALRALLHPDVWPHANRSSFVNLLADKDVPTPGILLFKAVGLRLAFRQPPPITCFSDQFLLYLNSSMADSAYHAWAHLNPGPAALLPPERFHFEVVSFAL